MFGERPVAGQLEPVCQPDSTPFRTENLKADCGTSALTNVPSTVSVMLDSVTPRLRTGRKMLSVTIELLHPEGEVAALFSDCQNAFPDVSMGSYPFSREARVFGTQLVLRCTDPDRLASAEADLRRRLAENGIA